MPPAGRRPAGGYRPDVVHTHALHQAARLRERPIPVVINLPGAPNPRYVADLREAARIAKGRHVSKTVKALVVPGSQAVRKAAEAEGLDKIFVAAGFEWRGAGCSM